MCFGAVLTVENELINQLDSSATLRIESRATQDGLDFFGQDFRSRQGLYQKVVHPVRSENSPSRRRRDEPLLPAEGNRSAFRPSQGRLATALGFGRMFQTTAERPIPGLGCCPSRVIVYTGTAMNNITQNDIALYLFVYHSPFGRQTVVTTSALAALAETRHCLMSTH
jgi:hypothetical protein